MSLDRNQKKYAERLAQYLITQPGQFRKMAERYQDRRYNWTQPWQLREFIEQNYPPSGFDLFDHLPDTTHQEYVFSVFVLGYELLGDASKPVADPSYTWLTHKGVVKSYFAQQMGLSPQTFDKKLKEIDNNRFSIEEIVKLSQIREQFINELRPQASPIELGNDED